MMQNSGWKEAEKELLSAELAVAEREGRSVRSVFERVAARTGRKPNSIRNYYYLKLREGQLSARSAHSFTPFTDAETRSLAEAMLLGRAEGRSVRAVALSLASGDRKKMLRYQNKFRSLVSSDAALLSEVAAALRSRGISCDPPQSLRPRAARREDAATILAQIAGDLARLAEII